MFSLLMKTLRRAGVVPKMSETERMAEEPDPELRDEERAFLEESPLASAS